MNGILESQKNQIEESNLFQNQISCLGIPMCLNRGLLRNFDLLLSETRRMSYFNSQQPPVVAPPPQGYPPKDAYPYPVQGYPVEGYLHPVYAAPPQYSHPPSKHDIGCLEGCLAALCCCCLLDACF